MIRKAFVAAWATCVCATTIPTHAATASAATPFGGTAVVLPGTIEAENFDEGGPSVAYVDATLGNRGGAYRQTDVDIEPTTDVGGGFNIGWTRAGEWLQYTANVSTTGTYALELRVASASTGGTLRVDVDGVSVTGTLTVPNTGGWQAWTTIRRDGIVLQGGLHRLRLVFVTAGTDGIANVNFLRVSPTAGALPAPWISADIGAPSPAGTATFVNNTYTVAGAGADIWGSADAFQFVSQPAAGDTQIVVRVGSVQNTNASAKAGVMLRESTAAGAAHVILDAEPSGNIEFMTRRSTGAVTTYLSGTTVTFPAWLKLSRTATTIVGSVSTDGVTWRQVGSLSASATLGLVGMAVTSHATTLNTSVFDNVAVAAPVLLPPAPTALAPVTPSNAATGVAVNTPLSWSAAGATSYDVKFGTNNPPPAAATGLASASYTPAPTTNGTTYYWQVVARNSGGSTTGPVWSFTTIVGAPAAPSVVTPADGTSGVALNALLSWSAASATSYDVQFGTSNPPPPAATGLASPSYAPAPTTNGATYYWQVVARNSGGSTTGPVWSFTTIVGAPAAPSVVTPADGTSGVALNALLSWSAAGATSYDVRFGTSSPPPPAATGLASSSYAPGSTTNGTIYYWQVVARNNGGATTGPVWSFTTASVPTPPPDPGASPTAYNAVTDRTTYYKPALPPLGPAGYTFNDPTFGSKILRVTDEFTRPGLPSRSYRAPSNAMLAAWNASSTAFYVISNDGTTIPFAFDGTTFSAARIQPSSTGNGGSTLGFYQEPMFSLVNPNLIYGAVSGGNNRTVGQYDFQTRTYTPIVDMDTIVSGLANTYLGVVMTGGTAPEKLIVVFGGGSQDYHYLLMWSPIDNLGTRKMLNTLTSTINGVPTNITLNFHLHSAYIDKSGRYVLLGPTAPDVGAPRNAAPNYVWDTATDTITATTWAMLAGGHGTAGYGVWINQDCCTSSTWDAMQWQFRYFNDLNHTNDLISPVLLPKEIFIDDHTTWHNSRPDALVPAISSTYRYADYASAWRAWDDEIIGIDTTGGIGGVTYRFAHHRSDSRSDADPAYTYFWYQPIASVSPNGRYVIFTSNWEKTLGMDAAEGTFRQDVFMVQLTPR